MRSTKEERELRGSWKWEENKVQASIPSHSKTKAKVPEATLSVTKTHS